MKLSTLIILSIVFLISKVNASWNPCINAKKEQQYKKVRLNSANMDSCYSSAIYLINRSKTKESGINLLTRFLYVKSSEYRVGAILDLGLNGDIKTIKILHRKGTDLILKNKGEELKYIVASLITLKGYLAARNLAIYARKKGKSNLMRIIRDEYLLFTTGDNFDKMVAVAGPGTTFNYSMKSVANWNPCIQAKKEKTYKGYKINSKNMKTCFFSALTLMNSKKSKNKGLKLLSKFLYVKDVRFRLFATIELGASRNTKAIKILRRIGVKAISRNRGTELEQIVAALMNLKGYSTARYLARYAIKKGRSKMVRIIRGEYLLDATGKDFDKMVSTTSSRSNS